VNEGLKLKQREMKVKKSDELTFSVHILRYEFCVLIAFKIIDIFTETDYAVGIDLGTTYSCVTVYKDGKFERIINSNEMFTTPSVVFYSEDDTYVGEDAVMRGQKNCKNCVSGMLTFVAFKRILLIVLTIQIIFN
jgi:hypothetical protein